MHAHAPYSHFPVGAALLCEDGTIVSGCNVENSSYSLGCCAERTAVFTAVAQGKTRFQAIAIVGGPQLTPPCGACRQVLVEFGLDLVVLLGNEEGEVKETDLARLLPEPFTPGFLLP